MGLKKESYTFQDIGTIISKLIEDLYSHHFKSSKYSKLPIKKINKETVFLKIVI
jgi:hypothetical protein